MALIEQVIRDDLAEIDRHQQSLAKALEHTRQSSDELLKGFHTAGLAALVESIYTGSERVLNLIAREVDGAPIPKSESWHRDLLARGRSSFGDRVAVISPETAELLDHLRKFRHKVRNDYSLNLDLEIVMQRAEQTLELARRFVVDLEAFLATRG